MRREPAFAAFAAVLIFAASTSAQDVSGLWEISWGTPRGAQTVLFTFSQDGAALGGSAEMTMGRPGGGGGESRTVEIADGKVEGDEISFSLVLGRGGRSFTMTVAGSVNGNEMRGSVTNPRGGENPFTGKRK